MLSKTEENSFFLHRKLCHITAAILSAFSNMLIVLERELVGTEKIIWTVLKCKRSP